MGERYPVYVPIRDRLSALRLLLGWLDRAGMDEVYLIDNGSTYPPLIDFLSETEHQVVWLGRNLGHRSPMLSGVVQRTAGDRYFVITDPDVVPDESCPLDAVDHFRHVFDEMTTLDVGVDKVGFGLRIDDLPASFVLRDEVIQWEEQFWRDEVLPGLYRAGIDSTFALYRPVGKRHDVHRAVRTGAPYLARHLPWYLDSAHLDDEERYYRAHVDPTISNWNRDRLARWKARDLAERARTTSPVPW